MIPARHNRIAAGVLCGLLALAAGGCTGFSVATPEVRYYRLQYDPPAGPSTPLDVALRIARIGVGAAYDREAIVYREGDYRVGAYMLHRWVANPSGMVSDLLARDLASSGSYRIVQRGMLMASDYDLSAEIEAIEEVVGEPSRANLRIGATLVRTSGPVNERVVLRKSYVAEEPVDGSSVTALVAAMSRAMARISVELQADLHAAIAARATRR